MGGSFFEVDSYIVGKYCKKYDLDFIEVLDVCKRLANEKNRMQNESK